MNTKSVYIAHSQTKYNMRGTELMRSYTNCKYVLELLWLITAVKIAQKNQLEEHLMGDKPREVKHNGRIASIFHEEAKWYF